MNQDEQHLKVLSICHYVYAGLMAVFSCFPLFYVGLGAMFLGGGPPGTQNPRDAPPAELGMLFVVIGLIGFAILLVTAVAVAVVGRFLTQRRNWLFCIIVSGIACMNVPLGTLLGVFTILVLLRPTVKEMFEATAAGRSPAAYPDRAQWG
jgi:hypothetical protein